MRYRVLYCEIYLDAITKCRFQRTEILKFASRYEALKKGSDLTNQYERDNDGVLILPAIIRVCVSDYDDNDYVLYMSEYGNVLGFVEKKQ